MRKIYVFENLTAEQKSKLQEVIFGEAIEYSVFDCTYEAAFIDEARCRLEDLFDGGELEIENEFEREKFINTHSKKLGRLLFNSDVMNSDTIEEITDDYIESLMIT